MERFISNKISSKELSILDNNSEWLGIPKSHLMECAGYSFATQIMNQGLVKKNSHVAIFCGTGNNGGDGFVIARHLSSYGVKVLVVLVGTPDKIRTPEAQLNWDIVFSNLNYSIATEIIDDASKLANIQQIIENEEKYGLIIDGLLGTGILGKIREPIASTIDLINNLNENNKESLKVASIDIPSGLDPDTGKVTDRAVKADLVITFHRKKKGMTKNNEYMKQIIELSIGIPIEASVFVGMGDLYPTLKKRKVDNYKGQFGRLLVIGGSKNYSGAPAYSSLTGIHFGCDLVITYVPEVIGDVIRSYSPNMIVRTSPGDWLNINALDEILELVDWATTIIIGPGLGVEKQTEELFVQILENMKPHKKGCVIDADALKLIKDHTELLKGKDTILTPHAGELKIMADIDLPTYENMEERGESIYETAKKIDATILVKGPFDYISDGKHLKINRTGCPEMSIGGTGDILAGLCGSFLTTKNNPFESACSAAFLNGIIGEYCKINIGPRFTAMDMIENLNNVLVEIQKA